MLSELKNRAVEADKAFSSFDEIFSDWYGILSSSESLSPLLSLDISSESKQLLSSLVDTASVLDKTYKELELKRDEIVLEYALALVGGKLGDIIDYVDHTGKNCSLVIESAFMYGTDVSIYGTRFLKSGHIGKTQGSVYLGNMSWALRK
ncbi:MULTISPECIES: hypothetical protein [Shewanella]|uniref:hypothetical protein n=1 Tax=Shewanella TaxID=22 RepID=UPI000DFB9489|nr:MULTISPECIES: hypothetical protein [Shewanella]MCK7633673.1 hypothetical protein [Shewanella sp. JNE17]MCK7648944.1 hypothetical protein [Shewanella sp. JNE8]MCK7656979.1 hypothetical protein [Shewanella sp. JNE4-2]UPO32646.1 hypothetical protein MZ182_07375 [Shewanella sp. JNE2]SUI60110.1 Uncharacterised protein [Shewanella putrefaciens]